MSIEIKLPDIGDDTVEVTEILVKVGDTITLEQTLLTVEGDKASMEIPSPQSGVVQSIDVKLGDKVVTGSPIMTFLALDNAQSSVDNSSIDATSAITTISAEQHFNLPDIGSDTVEVTELLVKVGDVVAKEQTLLTVEGDKASIEVPSPEAGTVTTIALKVGDKVTTGVPMLSLLVATSNENNNVTATEVTKTAVVSSTTESEPKAVAAASTLPPMTSPKGFVANNAYVHATPSVRSLAREFGIDLSKVNATGPKNRILRTDVQNYVKQLVQNNVAGQTVTSGGGLNNLLPLPTIDFSKFGEIEQVALGKIQKISGANLHRNWVMIPHVTQFDEVDITELELFRKQQNSEAEKARLNVKITPVVFILKAVAKALENYPRFNSSLSPDAQSLILKKYINIGLAVDTPNGLVVPVLRDVNKKGIITLSQELAEISKKARAGKLSSSDMQGGCFTISSLGGIGGTAFTPIVNAPEVAILGVSKSAMKPIWNGKEFVARLMLPLALSYDHRVIDGADGARFITYINQVIADIRRLAM